MLTQQRENVMIGGEGVIVEIDESAFGKRKYNRGRHVNTTWVFGGVERGTDKCFLEVVPDRTRVTLFDVIRRKVRPGSIIISDCWRAYVGLDNAGYQHLTVNHTYHFRDPNTGAHTNSIEGTWSAIKRSIIGTPKAEMLNSYLAEYMWRRKNNTQPALLVHTFLQDVIAIYPPASQD
jgi:transposase-like protein